jgi:hypothetical protein
LLFSHLTLQRDAASLMSIARKRDAESSPPEKAVSLDQETATK